MKKYLILLAGFAMLGMIACKKDPVFTAEEQYNILSVSGPPTGLINTDVDVAVTHPYSNGCDYLGRFEETKNGNIVSIKAYSKPVPKNSACTQDAGTRTMIYKFKSTTAGSYELRFMNRDGSFVNHAITIQ